MPEPNPAQALSNYSSRLLENGEYKEALKHARTALEVTEKLTYKNADRFESKWASALGNYANCLSGNGFYAEAVAHARMALELAEKLARKNADRFEPDLVWALGNYANRLSETGEYAEAVMCAHTSQEVLERLVAKLPLRFEEETYLHSLSMLWFKWLLDPRCVDFECVAPTMLMLSKPHRLITLETYRAWLRACLSSEYHQRASAFAEVLVSRTKLDIAQFREIEPYWVCASAWCTAYAPEIEPEVEWKSLWLSTWQQFFEQHSGRLPCWMDEVARRMNFAWPM